MRHLDSGFKVQETETLTEALISGVFREILGIFDKLSCDDLVLVYRGKSFTVLRSRQQFCQPLWGPKIKSLNSLGYSLYLEKGYI